MELQKIDAVFERGAFRLLSPANVSLPEGRRVRLTVEACDSPEDILSLATQVYEGLSESEIDEIEKIALDRKNFFGGRTPI